MKKIIVSLVSLILVSSAFAQKRYFTKTGVISFRAGTAVEDIDGINKSATTVFDAGTGQIEFALLVKSFEFKSALMQEHFNENYMESDKFPKSTFKGTITNISKVNFQADGSYPVTVKGTIEIHGIKKEVETTGLFKVSGESIVSTAEFTVTLEDFKIDIPSLVKDKISKTATIKVNSIYAVLK